MLSPNPASGLPHRLGHLPRKGEDVVKLIDPLEVEICRFVTFLDALLIGKVPGWRPFETGLKISLDKPLPAYSVKVIVAPVDWPAGSHIFLGLQRSGVGATWELHNGTIVAPHCEFTVPFSLARRFPTFLIVPMNPAALGARQFTEALEQAGALV